MNNDDSILIQLADAVRLSYLRDKPCFVGFLNEDETSDIIDYLKREKISDYLLWGGIKNAVRVMCGIFPERIEPKKDHFPIKTVKFDFPKQYKLSHRDFLGALMSLGIKRNCIGDIKIAEGVAYIALKSDISDYVISQIDKVGKVGVKPSYCEVFEISFDDDVVYLNLTVSSLRLDNVVSSVLNLSREKGAQAVKSGIVSVNHCVKQSPSFVLKQGDTIVYKGKGKFVVDSLAGESKKGKKKLIIRKYR